MKGEMVLDFHSNGRGSVVVLLVFDQEMNCRRTDKALIGCELNGPVRGHSRNTARRIVEQCQFPPARGKINFYAQRIHNNWFTGWRSYVVVIDLR